MSRKISRTISFYWLILRDRHDMGYQRIGDFDWRARLNELNSKTWPEKLYNDTRYDVILDKKYPILTILEKFDPAFMRVVDSDHEKVMDYMDDMLNNSESKLFNSSAVAFFPSHSLVAHVSSTSRIKNPKIITECLNHYYPIPDEEWMVIPVVNKDSLEKLYRDIEGVHSVEIAFPTQGDLFAPDVPEEGVVAFCQNLSAKIGGNLKVELRIKLANSAADRRVKKRFKEEVMSALHFASSQGSKALVSGEDFNQAMVELNLTEHKIVEHSEIEVPDGMPLYFTGLIDHLIDVCESRQEELYEIVER